MDDFDIDRIDEVIHGRLRLGIMAFLSTAQSTDFSALKARLQATGWLEKLAPNTASSKAA